MTTQIEEAVPVSDPVAEAVGRLTALVGAEQTAGFIINTLGTQSLEDLRTVLSALAKAGEELKRLSDERYGVLNENRVANEKLAKAGEELAAAKTGMFELEAEIAREAARAEAAEAQLASARRVMEPFAKDADQHQGLSDDAEPHEGPPYTVGDIRAAAEWLASQPVPDPTLEVTND